MKPRKLSFSERVLQERRNGRSMFSALFSSTWHSLGSFLGSYDAVDPRNMAMRGVIARPATAADLTTSIPYIRNLCRNYERNCATFRAASEGFVANVVGSGISLEPDTGDRDTDDKLREVWNDYARDCFINGMDLYEGQRVAARDVFVAGESLWRLVVDPERAKAGKIPLCICPLEPEWLGDSGQTLTGQSEGYIGGIKVDKYGRPLAYILNSPGGIGEEVEAKHIIHAFEQRRAVQFRGEPMGAPILTTLRQEKDLVTSELEAAKNTSSFAAAITTNGGLPPDMDERGDNVRNLQLGSILELQQGEDIKLLNHTRPSQQIAPFRDMLRGDIAGALRLGTRWLNRDISNANYSSMRADMLDNERLLAPVREWFGNQTVGRLYVKVLPYLCLMAGIEPPKSTKYRLVPDGQPYVDPEKDANAAALAIAYGLSTYEAEIGKRGGDYRQVWAKLAEERAELDTLGIVITSPTGMLVGCEEAMALGADNSGKSGEPKDDKKPEERAVNELQFRTVMAELASIRAEKSHQPTPPQQPPVVVEQRFNMDEVAAARMGEAIGRSIPKQEAAQVHVRNEITNPAPLVTVNNDVRAESAPVQQIIVPAAVVNVDLSPTPVTVQNSVNVEQRPMKFVADAAGNVVARPMEG